MLMRLKVSVFCFSFISRCATGIRPIRAVFVLYAHRKFYWTVPFKCTFSQATLSNFLKICHKDFQLFSSICRKNERHKRLRNAGRLKMQDWKMRHHQKYHQKFPNLLWIVVVLSHAFILTMCLYVYMCVCVCVPDCFLFTARCTLVQSAVLPSHVVCLSDCDVGGLWSHTLEFF